MFFCLLLFYLFSFIPLEPWTIQLCTLTSYSQNIRCTHNLLGNTNGKCAFVYTRNVNIPRTSTCWTQSCKCPLKKKRKLFEGTAWEAAARDHLKGMPIWNRSDLNEFKHVKYQPDSPLEYHTILASLFWDLHHSPVFSWYCFYAVYYLLDHSPHHYQFPSAKEYSTMFYSSQRVILAFLTKHTITSQEHL